MRSHVPIGTISRYGVKAPRSPTSHGITHSLLRRPWSAAYEEGFPVISRSCIRPELLPNRATRLPDKEFRYLRTVIVTAAVYRGLDLELRPKANPSS